MSTDDENNAKDASNIVAREESKTRSATTAHTITTEERLEEMYKEFKAEFGLLMRLSDIAAVTHTEEASTRVAIFKKSDKSPVWQSLAKSALRIGKRTEWYTRDVVRAIVLNQSPDNTDIADDE